MSTSEQMTAGDVMDVANSVFTVLLEEHHSSTPRDSDSVEVRSKREFIDWANAEIQRIQSLALYAARTRGLCAFAMWDIPFDEKELLHDQREYIDIILGDGPRRFLFQRIRDLKKEVERTMLDWD